MKVALDTKEQLSAEDAPVIRATEDHLLKVQILNRRLQGMSLIQISRQFGIKVKDLEKHLVRWLREEVGHEGELAQVLADVTFLRYETLLSKILPVLLDEDVKSHHFKNLIKMFQDITNSQLKVAGIVVEETKANTLEDTDLGAMEEEAKRLGIMV
jgi:hypothetical protein